MTDSYTWEWVSGQVALETMHRPWKIEDAEAVEVALPGHRVAGPAGPWGLVIDVRDGGVLDEAVQEVIKRVMRLGAELGCVAVALVNTKFVVQMQSKRLAAEAEHAPIPMFESVAEALAAVEGQVVAAV